MFDIHLPIYLFTKEHPLKTSNKRTHNPLIVNQFVSLIELKMYRSETIEPARVNLK